MTRLFTVLTWYFFEFPLKLYNSYFSFIKLFGCFTGLSDLPDRNVSAAPIQVQDINTSNQPDYSPQCDNETQPFNATLPENETIVIPNRINGRRRRSARLSSILSRPRSNFQEIVDDIVDVDPDEPIGNLLSSTPIRRSQRISGVTSAPAVKIVSPGPVTRSQRQIRYLTREETLERAAFSSMSPSIRWLSITKICKIWKY